ncbi:hypothetical protein LPJ61_003923, partial [Coemansia biformis]
KLVCPPYLTRYKGKALNAKWHGPHKVIKPISNNTYKIQLPTSMHIHDVISIDYLKQAKSSTNYKHLEILNTPPALDIDGEPLHGMVART